MTQFRVHNSPGRINDLLSLTADLLDIDVEDIRYKEDYATENGICQLKIPITALDSFPFEPSYLAGLLSDMIIDSYRVDIITGGGFRHTSVEKYNLGDMDPDRAYGGLDANGDPKPDVGGEYAGLIRRHTEQMGGTL